MEFEDLQFEEGGGTVVGGDLEGSDMTLVWSDIGELRPASQDDVEDARSEGATLVYNEIINKKKWHPRVINDSTMEWMIEGLSLPRLNIVKTKK